MFINIGVCSPPQYTTRCPFHYKSYKEEEEEEEEGEGEEELDNDEEREEAEDYSFSTSGFLEEGAFVDQAMLSRSLEDSTSFTFSTENASKTRECGPCDFPSTLPLLKHVHACDLGSSSAHDNFSQLCNDANQETAALVPFKISGSWQADSSFRHSARHSESRRSFSFLTDMENEEEFSEESVIYFKGAIMEKDSGMCSDGEDHVAATHNGDDEGKLHKYKGHSGCAGDQDGRHKHANGEQDDCKVNNVHMRTRNADTANIGADLFTHHDLIKHGDYGLLLPNQSNAEPNLRFAGEGLLQPWSSSKLSKSGKRRVNAEKSNSQGVTHHSSHESTISRHLHPLPLYAPTHDIKDYFNRKPGKRSSSHMPLSESALFSPSVMREAGSPTHGPICMPRKSSSLFARRMRNTSETLSLLVHAQKPARNSFAEAGLPSLSSNGSANSSSYRTSSIGSTQSSGYSSSSGKYCSTPNSSRNSSKSTSNVAAARCSLQQRMDAEPFKLQKHEEPNAKPHREGDPSAQLHSKGDKMYKEGDANMHAQAADQSKVKADPLYGAGHVVMSPSTTSSQSPRSPLSWRSVLSLQPLNPSHIPPNQWAKPSSRSHSQRSRSISRGNSGREGRAIRNPSATISQELLLMHTKYTGKKSSSVKGGMTTAAGTQKLVKTRRAYWALNPMQWFKHCRNEKQVVDTTTNLEPKERQCILMGS